MKFAVLPQLTLILITASGAVLGILACRAGSPYRDIIIDQNFKIQSEWREVSVENIVKVVGDHQFLSVTFDEPLHAAYGEDGMRAENGSLFNPEIVLIDREGSEYSLGYEGKLGNQRVNYGYKLGLPKGRTFTKLRIRSDFPFEAKKIIWTHYYTKDVH